MVASFGALPLRMIRSSRLEVVLSRRALAAGANVLPFVSACGVVSKTASCGVVSKVSTASRASSGLGLCATAGAAFTVLAVFTVLTAVAVFTAVG